MPVINSEDEHFVSYIRDWLRIYSTDIRISDARVRISNRDLRLFYITYTGTLYKHLKISQVFSTTRLAWFLVDIWSLENFLIA